MEHPASKISITRFISLLLLVSASTPCSAEGPASARQPMNSNPIGVFDSFTGGLGVLEARLRLERQSGLRNNYVFVGDKANFPYGGYVGSDPRLLRAIIMKTVRFLLSDQPGKPPAKALVIACNTATVCGEEAIRTYLRQKEMDIPVVGVIEPGAKAAVEVTPDHQSIGVFATEVTVAQNAYPQAIAKQLENHPGRIISVVQQAAQGLAAAIDGSPSYINISATEPRGTYEGPSLSNPQALIEPKLLPAYQFDFEQNRMLWTGDPRNPALLQINSLENYVSYHVVSLLERLRTNPGAHPLKTVILGCTHYPYLKDLFEAKLRQLYDFQDEQGRYPYRKLMDREVRLVDPADEAAIALEKALQARGLPGVRKWGELDRKVRYFFTRPNQAALATPLDVDGGFTPVYKFGRPVQAAAGDTVFVPATEEMLPPNTRTRIERALPNVWSTLARSLRLERVRRCLRTGMSKGISESL